MLKVILQPTPRSEGLSQRADILSETKKAREQRGTDLDTLDFINDSCRCRSP